MSRKIKYAFQCKNCGALETSGQAGESKHPHACRVCGSGVEFTIEGKPPVIVKTVKPDNWTALADLKSADLAKGFHRHGLTPDDVERHTPLPTAEPGRISKFVSVTAEDGPGSKDKAGANV